jgi:hypothetical protein
VAKYIIRRRRPPSQGWKTFLRNHTPHIATIEMFVVPTIGFRLLYGVVKAPQYLIRDRDASYGYVVTRRLAAMGIRDRPTAPRSPWQNGHIERLIGSIRRECLDHVLVLGEAHLRRVLGAYANDYNRARTHLALAKDAPLGRPIQTTGSVMAIPFLGGLHHRYTRMA